MTTTRITISGARGPAGPAGPQGAVPSIQPYWVEHAASGALALSYSVAADVFIYLRANITALTVTDLPDGLSMRIAFLQDATGSRTVSLDGTWVTGSPTPSISSSALTLSVIMVSRSGATYTVSGAVPYVPDYSLYLPLSGGTLTGNITIAKSTPVLKLDAAAVDEEATLTFARDGVDVWRMFLDEDDKLRIQRRAANGTLINSPLIFDYATGTVTCDNFLKTKGRKRLTAQFDRTSSSLGNVTGLTVDLLAGLTYGFRAYLHYTAHATSGHQYAMGGSCTATSIVYQTTSLSNATMANVIAARHAVLGGASGQVGSAAGTTLMEGCITVNVAGALRVQFALNTGSGVTSSLLAGSFFDVWEVD